MISKRRRPFVYALLLLTLSWGCKDESKDFIPRGRRALMQDNLDEAEKLFEAARKANPNSYSAQWGIAQVLGKRGNFEAQAKQLRDMLANEDFKERKPILDEELEKAIMALVAAAENDTTREKFLREALAVNKKSAANAQLAELLGKKANKAMGQGKPGDAHKIYEEIGTLRISRKDKRAAKQKGELAKFLAFRSGFMDGEFAQMKAGLIEQGLYDEKNQQFTVSLELEVVGDPKAEDFQKINQSNAIAYAAAGLRQLAFKVAGKDMPEGAQVGFSRSDVSIVEQGFDDEKKPKMYRIKVAVPEDAIISKIEDLRAGKFEIKKPEPPAADGGVPAPENGAAEGGEKAPEDKGGK
ncbi:MAG: tetratricopeptide repeat protein [Bradymonadia bacterium]